MQPSDFSETQFVMGFLREYLDELPKKYWLTNTILMPSTVEERKTGADFIIKHTKPKGSDFLQFKISDWLKDRRGLPLSQRKLDSNFFPCYRFKVYNSVKTKQFNVLRTLAQDRKNYCAYVAPHFHTFEEYNQYFSDRSIVPHSVEVECGQFNTSSFSGIRPGTNHHILFNLMAPNCWFCSDPLEISVKKSAFLSERQILNVAAELEWETYLNEILVLLQNSELQFLDTATNLSASGKIIYIAETLQRQANIFWIPRFTINV